VNNRNEGAASAESQGLAGASPHVSVGVVPALLPILAKPGARADAVADAVVLIVKRSCELGEFDRATVRGADGALREIIAPPAQAFARLAVAAERGAFDRQTPAAVVDRIFMTEAPEAV
jgi:hypothetical protein